MNVLLSRVSPATWRRAFLTGLLASLSLCALAQDATPMRFVYFHDYPPFSFEDEQGKPAGVFIDVFREIFESRMGISTQHQTLPWKRAQFMVREGQADAFCTVPTPERQSYTRVSNVSVVEVTFSAFTLAAHAQIEAMQRIETIENLESYVLTTYIGSLWAKRALKGMNVYWPHDLEHALIMVEKGRADLAVGVSNVLEFKLKKMDLNQKFIKIPATLDTRPFHLCISRNSPYVDTLSSFDNHLQSMVLDGSLNRLIAKY